MKGYKELGNRYLKHKKKHAALVVTSMVLSTMIIYIVITFYFGLMSSSKKIMEEMGNYYAAIYKIDDEHKDKLKNHVGVDNVDFANISYEWYFEDYYGYGLELISLEDVNQDTFGYELVEGEFPKNSSQIMISKDDLHLFKEDVKVGSKIILGSQSEDSLEDSDIFKEYTVSGIYERKHENDLLMSTTAFTIADDDMVLDAYIRFDEFKSWEEQIKKIVSDIGIDTTKTEYELNVGLTSFYGQDDDARAMAAMFLMVMVFVTYICMVMVRSLFTSNLMEKIRDFSIIRAIGGTDKQIERIFKREIYIEALFAFVIGVALSHVIMPILGNTMNFFTFKFEVSPVTILGAALFLFATISLAVLEPFGILKKVSAVEGIGLNFTLGKKKIKKRKGKIFRIFGIEGEYAYKNMRRNNKAFWNAVASFAISALLMTFIATFYANINKDVDLEVSAGNAYPYDIGVVMYNGDKTWSELKDIKETFNKEKYIIEAHENYNYFYTEPDGDNTSFKFTEEAAQLASQVMSDFYMSTEFVSVYVYTDEQLEKLNDYMVEDVDAKEILKDGGVILVNRCEYFDSNEGKNVTITPFENKVGERAKIANPAYVIKAMASDTGIQINQALEKYPELMTDLEIKGTCTQALYNVEYNVQIIMSYEYLNQYFTKDEMAVICEGFFVNVDESNYDKTEFDTLVYDKLKLTEWMYADESRLFMEEFEMVKVVLVFVVVFILVMGVINVLHNMVSEQQERSREIAILRSIGMSKKKVNKMLILEKVIIGLMAWLVGTGLGLLLSRVMIEPVIYFFETSFVTPWALYLLIGVGLIGLMVLLSLGIILSMGKLNIINSIRNND